MRVLVAGASGFVGCHFGATQYHSKPTADGSLGRDFRCRSRYMTIFCVVLV
jgi:hypothetical protein